MAEIIARVGKITGEAIARDLDGNVRRLKAGDPVRQGDVVQAADGGQVQLKLADGRDLEVRANEAAKIDAEVAAPDLPGATDSAVQDSPKGFAKVVKAIVGPDGTFSFDDEAGLVKAVDQKDGHTFIELVRIVENVYPLAFQFATERGQRLDEIRGGGSRVFTVPNNPPDSVDLKIAGSEDRVVEVRLAGSDGDGFVVGFAIISLPENGVLYSDAALTVPIRVGDTVTGPVFFKPDANWNGQASFQYAAIDNVGLQDATPATATITVASVDDDVSLAVPDVNGSATGQLSVAENATTTGTFAINAPDGLDPSAALTIAGVPVSKAALEGSGTTPVAIVTPEGRLTVTGFNPVTGVVTYSYDPSGSAKNHTAGEVADRISIVVKDEDGDIQSGTLNINITDTVPVAKPDANAITEDAATDVVVGNVVLTGAGADILGADATAVTGVVAGSAVPGSNVAAGSTSVAGGTVVAGLYGSLVLGADGSYSYRLDNTNAAVNALKDTETLSETFTYTITDADGDPSTTTLTITINGTTDGGPSIVPADGNAGATGQATVLEAGLTGPATTETTAGTINVGSPDGLTSVKVGGVTLTVAQLQALSVGSPQVIDTGEGTLTLTGFSGTGSAPLSGVISYTYSLKAALNQPGASESSDLIALEVTDRGNITTTGTLTVQIVDDTPTANADSNSVAEGTTSADSAVTGNVFSGSTPDVADRLGADTRANPVTAVSFGGAPQTVGSAFATTYGQLTLNADGSYSYRLDNTNAAVNALKDTETLSETFTYTITDADGDPSTTTLTITINGTTDGGPSIVPADGNAGATGQATVLEAGLTGPATTETTAGTINVGSPDGLTSVKVGGVTLTVAQLQALSVGSPQVIDTGEGTLTLTGFSGTGSAPLSGVISYTYSLKAALNQPGASESSDLIALEVTDRGNITTTGTLTVQIVDDTPTANADSNEITEDAAPNAVSGNVMTTGSGQDTLSADATRVTGAVAGIGMPGSNVASGTTSASGTTIVGVYGSIRIGSDGSYSYTLDNTKASVQALNAGESTTETFTYTITDADGDPSTTTLTITIRGTDDGVALTVPDTNAGVTGNASVPENGTLTGQTFTISASDGLDATAALTIAGTPVTKAALENSVTSNVTINTPEGVLTITGYNPVTGVVTYSYDPSGTRKDHTGGEVLDTISIVVKDDNGDTQPGNLVINIVDTAPLARPDTNTVTEDTAPNPVAGNVITTGGGADTLGADATVVTGIMAGSGTPGNNVASGTTSSNGASVNGTYGTLVQGADGSYSYTLDNARPAVQALARNQAVSESFTYTITDADGDPSSTTLTITVTGTNDVPIIDVRAGDADSASLTETNSGLIVSDTLSVFDVDTQDTVAASKVDSLVVGGTYSGARPTDTVLKGMFSVSGGEGSAVAQDAPNGIIWTFNSGSEAFNSIPAGQTLILTYTVRATDSQGASVDQPVTITITGTNDGVVAVNDTLTIAENATGAALGGNVLSNDTLDPDVGATTTVSSFSLDADGNGLQDVFTPGTPVTVTTPSGTLGVLTMASNGAYTFTPHQANYSGPVPVIAYTLSSSTGETATATLTLNVTPVSDAPGVTPDAPGVTTNEDTAVALGFNAPTVTDAIDQNGIGGSGDNPEMLSLITLSGIPSGAKLLDATNGDVTLFISTGGNITIRLSDASNLIASPGAATLTMTTAQFEALKVLPRADSGANFTVTMTVTEYEVDTSGNPLSGIAGVSASTTVAVNVLAVTDIVDLKIGGVDAPPAAPYNATISEDSALNLTALLSATFEDLDGSERRAIIINNPAGNGTILVNGTSVAGGGSITFAYNDSGNNLETSQSGFPAMSIVPASNFSGDLNGITVTLSASDRDSDPTAFNASPQIDRVTLNLHVTPVAGDVSVSNVSTPEDTAVKFLQGVALTDTDGSESITGIVVKSVPTGWVLKDDAGTVVFTGNGVATYTLPAGEVSNGDFRNYTLTPPAHSSANATISLDLTTTDTQTVNGSPVTSVQTVTRSETITVNAVAEIVGGDSNGDLVPDLSMTPGFVYTSQGAEDQWFILNSDGFNLKANWANQDADGSEQTFALLTPVLSGGSAIGSQFRYTDGSGVHVLTYNGTAVEIPMAYLNTVQFMAAPNVAGAFTIGVQARTVDTDSDTGASVSAVSGSATLTNLFIAPVADAVTLAVTGSVTGNEDSLIPLRIKPTSADPSETFNVTISNIPAGSTLVYDGMPVTITGNSATIANFDSTKSLAIQPPANSNTDFSLNVSAVSIDTVGGVTSTSSPTALSIAVDVRGVADSPAITSASLPFVTTEAAVDSGAKRIALSSIITSAALTDSDGSETLSFVLSGLPAGFTVEGLTFTGGVGAARVWAGTASEFASARIVVLDDNYSGSFDFKFRAITTENDGNSLTGNWTTVPVQVTPSPEATINVTTTASEDTLTRVDFALQSQNGDSNETLSSVWIKAAELVGKPFTLYLDSAGATPLTSLAVDDGWYKLTALQAANVFVKGTANSDADGTFGVRYGITDPSNDGTLAAVTQQFDTNYSITVNPVTDAATSSNDFVSRVIASTEVVTVNVTVTQSNDPNAGNAKDIDGSEKLLYFIVDSVPIGVTVVGGKYIGNTPGNPNTGRWILDIPDNAFSGPSLTQAVQFSLDGTATQLSSLSQAISITAYTQDTGASAAATSTTSWTLQTSSSFTDASPAPTTPAATIATWAKDPAVPSVTEDTPVTLNTLLDASISGTSPFAVTLTGLPAGAVVTGMMMTMVGGAPVWSAQGTGDNNALQALLNGITVTAPANANSNTGPLGFSATLTTYDDGGGRHDSNLTVSLPVTPVSDPIVLVATDSNVGEDATAPISIVLSNAADGANTNVVNGTVYVQLDDSGMEASGGVLRFNGNPVTATTVSGVSGIADGTYFVLNGVSNGSTLNLTYQPAANASGTVGYTAFVQNQETGAANVVTSSTSGSFDINKVNDGVTLSAGNVTGAEDQAVQLAISAALIDSGERIQSVTLSHVPDGFQVYYGNGAPGTAAINMGGGVWSIPASAGAVPAYISLVPPPNWSGTVSGVTAEVWSGETGLDQTVNLANFDVTFNGVADGILISPTLSFGNEGQVVLLNLNSAMPDMDGSETAIITVKGLGSFAAFYAGSSLLSASYNSGSDTYTLSGLTPAQVSGLGVIQKDGSFDLVITAQTADSPGGNLSAVVSASMHVDINPVAETTGDDRLLYDGSALNGLAGVDTIEFRLGENLDFSASPVKPSNIERFDLMPAGQNHSLGHLSVQDVLDMTGSGKSLTILGDSGDSVSLKGTVGGTWSAGGSQTVDGHNFDVYLNTQDPAVRVLIEQQIVKSIDP